MTERATELEWLEYFYQHADFGPAHEDVVDLIQNAFIDETGKKLHSSYVWEE